MRREIPVEQAIGMVLAHDMTQILPGVRKDVLFRKGHMVQEEDIPALLSIGKRHIFVLSLEAHEAHEDEAARFMADCLAHPSLAASEPREGKINLRAAHDGLLLVDAPALFGLNSIGDLAVVTKRAFTPVRAAQTVAGLRAIPLVIPRARLALFAQGTAGRTTLQVLPFLPLRVGVVTTGSEVLSGRIEDRSGPVLREKIAAVGLEWLGQTIVDDELSHIADAIRAWLSAGAELVLVTGGMSVDPDDRSPAAIREVADDVASYGMPVLPGSMTMLAYAGDAAIMGLPGCVIYDEVTAFDWLLPRIAAGIRPTREDIATLGHGGLM